MRAPGRRPQQALLLSAAVALVLAALPATSAAEAFDVTATAGQQFSGDVARQPYCDCTVDSATIDWGDGQSSAGVLRDADSHTGSSDVLVSGTHTWAQAGTYTITVRTYRDSGTLGIYTATARVAARPPLPVPPPVARFALPAKANALTVTRLDATTSSRAERYLWDLDSDGRTDAECGGGAPVLETRLRAAGAQRVTLTVEAADGRRTSSMLNTQLAAPRGSLAANRTPISYTCVAAQIAALDPTGNGGPPAGCATTLTFETVQAIGCLDRVDAIEDIPIRERPILDELIRAWNSTPQYRTYVNTVCTMVRIVGGNSPPCPPRIVNRSQTPATLVASDVHVSRLTVRINGLDIEPQGRASVVLAPQIGRITSSNAIVKMGDVVLRRGPLNLDVEDRRVDQRNPYSASSVKLAAFNSRRDMPKIGGFSFDGQIEVELARFPYRTNVTVRLALPRGFSLGGNEPASGRTKFSLTNARGLAIDELDLRIRRVYAGPLGIDNAFFHYRRAGEQWEGGGNILIGDAGVLLAPPPSTNGIGFRRGSLYKAGGRIRFGTPIPPPQLFPGVFLDEIGFGIALDPTLIRGDATISVAQLSRISGTLLIAFPSPGQPYHLSADDAGGPLRQLAGRTFTSTTIAAGGAVALKVPRLGDLNLGDGYLLYSDPGYVATGGFVRVNMPGMFVEGGVNGELSIPRRAFNIDGRVRACLAGGLGCLGASALISSTGVAACGEIRVNYVFGSATLRPGAGYRWGDSWPTIWLIDGCKTSPYRAQVARAAADGSRSFTVARGLPSKMVKLTGRPGAAPRVRVTAPDGEQIESLATNVAISKSKRMRILRQDEPGITWIGVEDPRPGRYRVDPLPDSAPLTRLATADGLRPARIRARVTGRGATRVLRYVAPRRPGQRIVFEERGPATARAIGSTAGGKGRLRFRPAVGRGGRRTVLARVQLGGLPSEAKTVARFRAPDTARPGRALRLRLRRGAKAIVTRWRARGNARRWRVIVRPRSGDRRLVTVPGARRRLKVAIAPTQSGALIVRAVSATGAVGRPTVVRFKARKPAKTRLDRFNRGTGLRAGRPPRARS